MAENKKSIQKEKINEEMTTVFHIVKKGRGLELQEIEVPKKEYTVVNKIDLKTSFAEQTFYLKQFFIDFLLKLR